LLVFKEVCSKAVSNHDTAFFVVWGGNWMAAKKGFTLIEIIVVLVIIGILTAIAIPNYYTSIYNSRVHGVENNLRAIAAAQSRYYEDHGNYYFSNDFGSINSNLSLSMASVNDGFTYQCIAGSPLTCSATNDPNMTVSVDINGNITCSSGTCP
jgi:type IV pilus assembly protein PilA